MSDSREARIAAELTQLRTRYLARVPLELAALSTLAARLGGRANERPQIEELHQRLHKLAGSGGTFGLADLSLQARRLEYSAKEILSHLVTDIDEAGDAWREFTVGVAALLTTLDQAKPLEPAFVCQAAPVGTQATKLWLVEDDSILAAELKIQLEQFGYAVRTFQHICQAESATPWIIRIF